jgi:hypothetical protein
MIKAHLKTSVSSITLRETYLSFIGAAIEVYDNRPMTVPWDDDADFPTKSEVVDWIKT